MSTYYLLPSRPLLGQRFGEFLETLFPGLPWSRTQWPDLAETLGQAAHAHPGVYVIYREDVADDVRLEDALARDFGAEAGDEIIEVALGGRLARLALRRWHLGAQDQPPLAA